jgi:hypothetical protein
VTLQDLGSIGEFAGAVLVVVTLFYLAAQIRQNTRSLQSASFQEMVRAANDWSTLFVVHPETGSLWTRGLADPKSLDKADRLRFQQLVNMFVRNYATVLAMARDGLVPLSTCTAYEAAIVRQFRTPDMRDWWSAHEQYFEQSLRDRMRELLAA